LLHNSNIPNVTQTFELKTISAILVLNFPGSNSQGDQRRCQAVAGKKEQGNGRQGRNGTNLFPF